jgi:hypothetical protein
MPSVNPPASCSGFEPVPVGLVAGKMNRAKKTK